MAIDDFDGLKTAVANWLNRTDLTDRIPEFIDNAENSLRRDPRVRKQRTQTLSASAEEVELPDDFRALESLYHDGGTVFGELEIVSPDELGAVNRIDAGAAGVPTHAAVIDQDVIRFAPPPDETYSLKMSYWATIARLSDTNRANWLLDDHSDVYLYATLVESAPFLRDDPRTALWESLRDRRLEELHMNTERGQFSGTLRRRVDRHLP